MVRLIRYCLILALVLWVYSTLAELVAPDFNLLDPPTQDLRKALS